MSKVLAHFYASDGRGAEALAKLMVRALGVPKSAVAIQRGDQSRTKILAIEGLSEDEAKLRLTCL